MISAFFQARHNVIDGVLIFVGVSTVTGVLIAGFITVPGIPPVFGVIAAAGVPTVAGIPSAGVPTIAGIPSVTFCSWCVRSSCIHTVAGVRAVADVPFFW